MTVGTRVLPWLFSARADLLAFGGSAALSLILLTLAAFGLYTLVASPLLRYHETHDRNDVQAISLIIILWVATALIYPSLHKFAVWLTDKIILQRANYEKLRLAFALDENVRTASHGKIALMKVLIDTNILLDFLLEREPCNSPYAERRSALIPQPLLPEREKGSKRRF